MSDNEVDEYRKLDEEEEVDSIQEERLKSRSRKINKSQYLYLSILFCFLLGLIIIIILYFTGELLPSSSSSNEENGYEEEFRLQFHFSPLKNFMNDPNGLVFYNGTFHLFFQYNPYGNIHANMSWGHAVSNDRVLWTQLDTALYMENNTEIFSGCAVVDYTNSALLNTTLDPALIIIYTGNNDTNGLETQNLAYSNDAGMSWTKYTDNPVIDIQSEAFRDPKAFWCSTTNQWVLATALSDKHQIRFWGSKDLKDWYILSDFGPLGSIDGVWECPDMFPLKDPDDDKLFWVLIVSTNPGGYAGGSGVQYFVGNWNGTHFETEDYTYPIWLDYGPDFYAPSSWTYGNGSDSLTLGKTNIDATTPDNRTWVAWLGNWNYANVVPTAPWRGAFSIPRTLNLYKNTKDGEYRIKQTPIGELVQLRGVPWLLDENTVVKESNGSAWINDEPAADTNVIPLLSPSGFPGGNLIEVDSVFQFNTPAAGLHFGFKFMNGSTQQTVVAVTVNNDSSVNVTTDRRHSGLTNFSSNFSGVYGGSITSIGKDANSVYEVHLRIYLDQSSLEVLINDGRLSITTLIFPDSKQNQFRFYVTNGTVIINSLKVFTLKSIWR